MCNLYIVILIVQNNGLTNGNNDIVIAIVLSRLKITTTV